MERFLWKGRIKEGKKRQYIERHNQIWPEMIQMLNEAGIHNYSIWLIDDELIGYYESENIEFANRFQEISPVNEKWDLYMEDVMYMEMDSETGKNIECKEIFYHK